MQKHTEIMMQKGFHFYIINKEVLSCFANLRVDWYDAFLTDNSKGEQICRLEIDLFTKLGYIHITW